MADGEVVYVWPVAGGLVRSANGAQTVCVCPSVELDVPPAPSQAGTVGFVDVLGVRVLVGGMTIGTLFTLLVIPSVYVLIAKDHSKERARAATEGAETDASSAPTTPEGLATG